MEHIGTQSFETERLLLRRLTIKDANAAFTNWCGNSNVSKYVTWSTHENIAQTKKLFEFWVKEYEDLTTYRWIVELKENHDIIGTIDIANKKYIPYNTAEIGYVYGESFWGKGYGTEALKGVIQYLFENTPIEVIFAEYMVNNPASGNVMKKAGMTFEGIVRGRIKDGLGNRNDLGSYSILKSEYIKN